MAIRATTGRSGGLKTQVFLLVLGFSLLAASGAHATATNLFIKFDNIDGGSAAIGHEKWSNILTVNWGVSAAAAPSGSGAGTGKAVLSDLTWTQVQDKSFSPEVGDCIAGRNIADAHVDFVTTGDKPFTYFKMDFTDVHIKSLDLAGKTGADTIISGDFAYKTILLTFISQRPDGAPGDSIETFFDLEHNVGSIGALAEVFALGLAGPTTTPAVPIPASLLLFGSGLVGLAGLRRKFSR